MVIFKQDSIKLQSKRSFVPLAAFLLTAVLLVFVHLKVKEPVLLLLERFVKGGGWIEIFFLSVYAYVVCGKLLDPVKTPKVRRTIWMIFSIVFFSQLLLGLAGIDKMLMTGKLHLPVPALILGGPLFRGDGFFMLILFGAMVLAAGPAWCSYLCYIGAWDSAAANAKRRPGPLPKWRHILRIIILVLTVAAAVGFRLLGVPPVSAGILAAAFGLAGVGVMIVISRKMGLMTHCVTYCPMGLVADLWGKLAPFRLKIGNSCDRCGACTPVCRYDALNPQHIAANKPGLSCTLCGDCVHRCKSGAIHYKMPGLSPETSRNVFIVLVTAMNAVSLGVARL